MVARPGERSKIDTECDVAALVFSPTEDPDALLEGFASDLLSQGFKVVGVIQHGWCQHQASLPVTLLPSRHTIGLAQLAGVGRGSCGLDPNAFAAAAGQLRGLLARPGTDLLILNRFGKLEQEGCGWRDAIVD